MLLFEGFLSVDMVMSLKWIFVGSMLVLSMEGGGATNSSFLSIDFFSPGSKSSPSQSLSLPSFCCSLVRVMWRKCLRCWSCSSNSLRSLAFRLNLLFFFILCIYVCIYVWMDGVCVTMCMKATLGRASHQYSSCTTNCQCRRKSCAQIFRTCLSICPPLL